MNWIFCPECGRPAEVLWRRQLASTAGAVEHAALRCVDRHVFVMPTAGLPAAELADRSLAGARR